MVYWGKKVWGLGFKKVCRVWGFGDVRCWDLQGFGIEGSGSGASGSSYFIGYAMCTSYGFLALL